MSISYKERIKAFDNLLSADDLDLKVFRRFCFEGLENVCMKALKTHSAPLGIPDGGGRRPTSWRILLNYLPAQRSEWQQILTSQRKLYKELVDDIILSSIDAKSSTDDHPLNPNPDSRWQSFFKDNEVLLQIDKDVRRLCPDISFFSQPTLHPNPNVVDGQHERLHQRVQQTSLNSQTLVRQGLGLSKLILSKKKALENYAPLEKGQEAHWEVVERILFLYAKLNPGQSYVQGMNEIIGPIYYVFASDPRDEWRAHAEADCFFCFTNLMSDIRDFFIRTLDESESGINKMMHRFMSELKKVDVEVYDRIATQDIKPQFFSFRWLTLMLSQEFDLPDVLRIWDSLLCDETRHNFLIDVCVAMVVLVREQILRNEFPDNMKLLQNYPPTDVQQIIAKAASLSKTDANWR